MLLKFLQWFGISCRHRHLSHPYAATAVSRSHNDNWDAVAESGGHYVVCLDCGHKFRYDWSKMRVIWQ
jgi:hypothetical protein